MPPAAPGLAERHLQALRAAGAAGTAGEGLHPWLGTIKRGRVGRVAKHW